MPRVLASRQTKKPAYRVPSMAEIAAIPPNGFTVASTFSGCGGSSLGYKLAGFKVAWASEFIPAAQETYRANHPQTILDTRDIRAVRPEEILEATGLRVGELDLLDGSPPCASFSTAGKREAGWGKVKAYSDTTQRTDDLFFEFSRILTGLRPRTFVAENVSGLVKGTAKGYFLEILRALKACGYRVSCRVLDAQYLGVPQMRQRTIFVGVRDDLELEPAHPAPLPYRYTAGEVVRGLKAPRNREERGKILKESTETYRYWKASRAGDSLEDACRRLTGKSSFLTHVKLSPSRPANTVTQGVQQLYHWIEPRTLSIPELKRISGFPDDFVLTGDFSRRWERLARAVPPPMMARVAEVVRDRILRRIP